MQKYDGESTYDPELEERYAFWKHADQILQERDPENLKLLLRNSLAKYPNVSADDVEEGITFMENAHAGQKRQFTGDPYIVHPLQVANIGLHMMAPQEVTATDVNMFLTHDTIEDTETQPADLIEVFNQHMAQGVVALSHTVSNGEKMPIPQYHDQILATHEESPRLWLPYKKAADYIVNANDPRNAAGLKDPFTTFETWQRKSQKKIQEMLSFQDSLPPEEIYLRHLLTEAAAYSRQVKEPHFSMQSFKNNLAQERHRQMPPR
jgi:hypothetical protein